ncbi:MAG: PAAR domain-containing protein, partial [Vibrio sp.]
GARLIPSVSNVSIHGFRVIVIGDKTSPCPVCSEVGVVIEGVTKFRTTFMGKQVAVDRCIVHCNCPHGSNRIIAPLGAIGLNTSRIQMASMPEPVQQPLASSQRNNIAAQHPAYLTGNYPKPPTDQTYPVAKIQYTQNVQVCIFSREDASKCILNLWAQKQKEGETLGTHTLKIIDDIRSKIEIGTGFVSTAKLITALGGFGITVKEFKDELGKSRIIISSLWNDSKMHYAVVNGLNVKKNHPYLVTNPTIKQLGVLSKDTINGFKKGAVITFVVSAAINTNELIFNDDYHLVDWCGHVGSDLFKAMAVLAMSAVGVAIAGALSITVPVLAGSLLWVGIDIYISSIWDKFKIEDYITDSLKEAVNE